MNFEWAMVIAMISGVIGVMMFYIDKQYCVNFIKLKYNKKINKKILNFICYTIGILGVLLYFSFLIVLMSGKHVNSSFTYEEAIIDKLTLGVVYFEDITCDLDEKYVILEEPNKNCNNIVLIETEYYELQWIFKIKTTSTKYHIYLDEHVYERLKDGNVIYKKED